jgi:hypothetical protein
MRVCDDRHEALDLQHEPMPIEIYQQSVSINIATPSVI